MPAETKAKPTAKSKAKAAPADKIEVVETPAEGAAPAATGTAATAAKPAPQPVKYSGSGGLVQFMRNNALSFAFSSYQSGRFYLVGTNPKGGLMINERYFQKVMGISAISRDTVIVATLAQVHRFENTLAADQQINGTFDVCYVPRVSFTIGAVDAHDVGLLADGRIAFVNTKFNCIATVSDSRSFKPIWKPGFISSIIEEDRCHLNGLAMDKGAPAYVTAVSKSDTIDGWRDRRADGGIVIDVRTNKIVCEGLSMPHSPRVYGGKLWVLNSGAGELGWVDLDAKSPREAFRPVAFCPGFVRGLSFHGKYAFVGLSKPRYERFEGLALDQKLKDADSEPWCGVQIIDLDTGRVAEWLRLDGPVAELYDTAVIPGARTPMSIGFSSGDIASLITHEPMEVLK